jgi:hypothetical protein
VRRVECLVQVQGRSGHGERNVGIPHSGMQSESCPGCEQEMWVWCQSLSGLISWWGVALCPDRRPTSGTGSEMGQTTEVGVITTRSQVE